MPGWNTLEYEFRVAHGQTGVLFPIIRKVEYLSELRIEVACWGNDVVDASPYAQGLLDQGGMYGYQGQIFGRVQSPEGLQITLFQVMAGVKREALQTIFLASPVHPVLN